LEAGAGAGAAGSSIRGLYNVRYAFIQSKGDYWGQLNVCIHICIALSDSKNAKIFDRYAFLGIIGPSDTSTGFWLV
jgi:hypothetical protein